MKLALSDTLKTGFVASRPNYALKFCLQKDLYVTQNVKKKYGCTVNFVQSEHHSKYVNYSQSFLCVLRAPCATLCIKYVSRMLDISKSYNIKGHTYETAIVPEACIENKMSQCMRFPTMWHFDKCRLGRASAASS